MKSVTALLFLALVASTMAVYVVNNGIGYGHGLGYYGGMVHPVGYGRTYLQRPNLSAIGYRGLGYYGGLGYYNRLGYGMGYWKK